MVSLAAAWQAAGVVPDAVVGHSQGEIAAATVAGILSAGGRRQGGGAAQPGAGGRWPGAAGWCRWPSRPRRSGTRIAPWGGRLSVAAVNGPAATVVSGEPAALAELAAACEADGVRARAVPVDYASHSAAGRGDPRGDPGRCWPAITPGPARVPMVSAMTGAVAGRPGGRGGVLVRQPARAGGVRAGRCGCWRRCGHRVFIEVSPHPVLTAAVTETLEDAARRRRRDRPPGR